MMRQQSGSIINSASVISATTSEGAKGVNRVLDHGSHVMLNGNIRSNKTGSPAEFSGKRFAYLSAAPGDDDSRAFVDVDLRSAWPRRSHKPLKP